MDGPRVATPTLLVILACLAGCGREAVGGEVVVAVAANFSEAIEALKADFESDSPHRLRVSIGSTGALYAQVRSGAPFDVLLAADQRRPALLEEEGQAIAGSRFTYAIGKLVLWSPESDRVTENGVSTLRAGNFRKLAIANPDLAPYGAAARETLENLDLFAATEPKLVMGANIGQTHAMVATGNAAIGFVALSYLDSPRNRQPGSRWIVPAELHAPIRQDAVLLERATDNEAAKALLAYLKGERAAEIIERFGYRPAS